MFTAETLAPFLTAAQAKVNATYEAFQARSETKFIPPSLSLEIGRRYARIVSTDSHGSSRSAFGFVDLTNGDVLKSDGWKSPAKNFARGNVADANTGTGRMNWTSVS